MSYSPDESLESSLVVENEAGLRSLEHEVLGLHDQLRARLLRYAVSLGLSPHDAEDVIQEVFLALFRHLQAGRSRVNLAGWTFRVTHNLSLKKRIRQNADVGGTNDDLWASHLESAGGNPEEEMIFNERHLILRRTFEALPEVDRLCIQLRAEGLKYREIAEILGISLGGVANYLSRSFGRLRRSEGGET
ncbi:RNA polymerase sigma factor [Edaphobacter sp. 12200R-103]|uniref:RNA polymerase sigma factor n=1 Tax=Edaphobacter sp. 12200R-103 TaxID=2703788 RepID=UPI00138B730C|nr:RNA polymerase sigma factor [Edaphobacter sp. 12200R-103]QHS53028.1 RNA polymerase sigma factor [Edaphobacter sp. 12200R-103]